MGPKIRRHEPSSTLTRAALACLAASLCAALAPAVVSALVLPPRPAPAAVTPPPPAPKVIASPAPRDVVTPSSLAKQLAGLVRTFHVDGRTLPDRAYQRPEDVLAALGDPTSALEPDEDATASALLGDFTPGTRAATPAEEDEINTILRAGELIEARGRVSFGFTGLQVGGRGRETVIEGVVDGSPAARVGLEVGDRIVAVNGRSTVGVPPWIVAGRINRLMSDVVTLSIQAAHGVSEVTVGMRLPMEPIAAPSTTTVLAGGIGLVRIPTLDEASVALPPAAELARYRGVIVDLRANPGGLIASAARVGQQLVAAKGPFMKILEEPEPSVYEQPRELARKPMVVLVDGGTGGSAEVLAQTLREQNGARIIGTPTMGRNRVYSSFLLDDGSQVKLRTGLLVTGVGTSIEGRGVPLDELVAVGQRHGQDPRRDPALAAAIAYLNK